MDIGENMKQYVKIVLSILTILLSFCVSAYGFVYTSGPSGGYGGEPFYIWPTLPNEKMKIVEIRIRSGKLIDAIQVVYNFTDNGVTYVTGRFGGSGGRQHVFKLDDDEYIKEMRGRCDNLIHSINFVTNKKRSPTYGGNGGSRFFRYRAADNIEIAGFFGRTGLHVDSIGAFYRIINRNKYVASTDVNEHAGFSGGVGGKHFGITPPYYQHTYYEDYTISEINIWADTFINGIQATYRHRMDGTNLTPSPVYGSMRGRKRTFLLDSNEFITAIYGKYGAVIDSIILETNKRTSPKYGGSGGGQWYRYEVPKESRINGFMGYSGKHIDSIGVITGSIYPPGFQNVPVIIHTPRGSVVEAELFREAASDWLKEVDQAAENLIKINGWNAYIIGRSSATYNCHGYAWHGIKRGEKLKIDGEKISKYWEDGSYSEIDEHEATQGDIISYRADHSAVITNKTNQGLWCISKWYEGPLVSHLCTDCQYFTEGDQLKYYRRNRP